VSAKRRCFATALVAAQAMFAVAIEPGPLIVEVTVTDTGSAPVAAMVVAEPVATIGNRSTKTLSVPAYKGTARLQLTPGGWRITATAPGRLGQSVRFFIAAASGSQSKQITLTLWPIGRIAGTLSVHKAERVPGAVSLRLWRGGSPGTYGELLLEDSIHCPIRQGQWECEVPAGVRFDLQVEASPFAPRYVWDIDVPEGQIRRTGHLQLFRGSSLTGWVVAADGRSPTAGSLVELTASDGAPLRSPGNHQYQFKTTSNTRGFFQIGPVPLGVYHVTATMKAQVTDKALVRVATENEERLRSPLLLKPPGTLHVFVDPPADPQGRPWLIHLVSRYGQHSGHRAVSGEPVSAAGVWSKNGLPAGRYSLSLKGGRSGTWYEKMIDVEAGRIGEEHIRIQPLRVQGSASFGDRPLVGQVVLAEDRSNARVSFETDENGAFSGEFPSVNLETASWWANVRSSKPVFNQTLRRVEPERQGESDLTFIFKLPDGRIEGTVVDEGGTPQSALVRAEEQKPDDPERKDLVSSKTLTTPSTGRFQIAGLASGEYRVHARDMKAGDQFVSDAISAKVTPGKAASVTLVLKKALTLTGRVETVSRVSVPGATVAVVPADQPQLPIRLRQTDADGRFELRVPAGTREVLINVWAGGVGRRILGRRIPRDGVLTVELDPTTAGTIVVPLGDPAAISGTYLYHDGGFIPLAHLRSDAMQARGEGGGEVTTEALRVPLMRSGPYRLCRLSSFPSEYSAFMAGMLPKGRCNEGQLLPRGELRLELPASLSATAKTDARLR